MSPLLEEDQLRANGVVQSMNVTWVLGWPDGHECGNFLTTDLGGTNLRVCWIKLTERHGETNVIQQEYRLADELKTGESDALFDFIATSLGDFIEKHKLGGTKDDPLKLGFTFSYPAHQDYIDHGKLVTWTKGLEIKGVEGEDAAGLLRQAMAKRVCGPHPLSENITNTVLGPPNPPSSPNKRHHWRYDSIRLQRPGNHRRRHIRHRL